jgi:hypothetical protein
MNLPGHPLLKELVALEESTKNRIEFHSLSKSIFENLKSDADFFDQIVRQNFSDTSFLNQKWSLYNIPSLYIGETADIILKYHVFAPLEKHKPGIGASTIHHHSNYILSTTAVLGSGYETFMFDSNLKLNESDMTVNLRITRHLTEEQNTFSIVDAWEPHVVFNPSQLSATLLMWTTNRKRSTDALRHNPILKSVKTPLRKAIGVLGLENKFGITAKTHQYYPQDFEFKAVDEDEFFAPTRAAVGDWVNDYSIQAIFAFVQRMGWRNQSFLEKMLKDENVPSYYHKFIQQLLDNDPIKDVYAKEKINIPRGMFTKDQILNAHEKLWGKFEA